MAILVIAWRSSHVDTEQIRRLLRIGAFSPTSCAASRGGAVVHRALLEQLTQDDDAGIALAGALLGQAVDAGG